MFDASFWKMIEVEVMIAKSTSKNFYKLPAQNRQLFGNDDENGKRQWRPLQLITFRVIRMGMIYIFVQIGRRRSLNRPAAGSATNWEKSNVEK